MYVKLQIGNWSRCLTDLLDNDSNDALEDKNELDDDRGQESSIKSFHLLSALSDLMMLPKDMLLDGSVRKEVCSYYSDPSIYIYIFQILLFVFFMSSHLPC